MNAAWASTMVFATDHLGSHTATLATAGLTAAAGYSPFGRLSAVTVEGGGTVTFGYRGELHTGDLVHLRHRDYQPATGTFLTADPLDGVVGYPTVVNGYHYAHNDPLGLVDPLGLRPWSDADLRGWFTDTHGNNIALCGLATFSEAIGNFFTAGLLYRERSCTNPIYDPSWTSGHYTSEAITAATTAHALAATRTPLFAGRSRSAIASQTTPSAPVPAGASYGRLGSVVPNPDIALKGLRGSSRTGHALHQIINRGVKPDLLLRTLRGPRLVLQQAGDRYLYLRDEAAVVIRGDGQVVTAWTRNEFLPRIRQILRDAGGTP